MSRPISSWPNGCSPDGEARPPSHVGRRQRRRAAGVRHGHRSRGGPLPPAGDRAPADRGDGEQHDEREDATRRSCAPRWRKNRRRTIWPWVRPSTSLSSMAFSTTRRLAVAVGALARGCGVGHAFTRIRGVEDRVDEVRDEVGEDRERADDDEVGHHRVRLDLVAGESTNSWPMPRQPKIGLGDDRAADERADVERDDRRDRDQRVAERVPHDRRCAR